MQKSARVLSLCLLLALVLSLGMPAAFADDAAGAAAPAGAEEQLPENGTPKAAVPTGEVEKTDAAPAAPTEPAKDVQPTVTKPVDTLAAPTADGDYCGAGNHDFIWVNSVTSIDGSCHQECTKCGRWGFSWIHDKTRDAGVAATCTTAGREPGTYCSRCGTTFSGRSIIPAKGHSYGDWQVTKAATCTEDGIKEHTCSVCNDIETAAIPALEHKEEIIPGKAATCTESGSTEGSHCSVCGEVLVAQEIIPATGHTEETIPGKAATCTETGLTEGKKCSVCGETVVAQEIIPALGHKLATENGKAPTCEEAGTADKDVCARCGEVLREAEIIPATGHDWGAWKDNGNGTHTRTCKNDASHTQTENHNVVEIASVPATCTTPGASGGKWCSDCHAIIEAPKIIPATGHDWGAWANTGDGKTHVRVCANDPSHTEYQQHKMGPWETVKYNTETTDGYRQRWCLAPDCDYHETQVIKAGAPKTGDSSNIMLYSGLCLAAVCGTAGVLVYVKRKKAE